MYRLTPALRHYDWGSPTAIPELIGREADGRAVAEAWFGAHPQGSSLVEHRDFPTLTLAQVVATDPAGLLGRDVVERFGPELPFLLKLVAPVSPLSLQVHPSLEQAALGWVREERAGVAAGADNRTYRDTNHKPEMLYALETFEALSGFRTPRRAVEILTGLKAPLIEKTIERLRYGHSAQAVRSAFEYVLLGARDRDADVAAVVAQIEERLASRTSPSLHADEIALRIAREHPGDRGVLASLLLNPVTLRPGEAMFVPAGAVHAYVSGVGVEVMASSDNVVRAGITRKHVDARALLDIVDVRPAPPIRLAPEHARTGVEVFYAPVEDFELAVITVADADEPVAIDGGGPRILLAIEGELELCHGDRVEPLVRGAAVFLSDGEDPVVRGHGRLVRAGVP
ncbi:mannose-6-phosphate isomerase, class I [Litorihabitans aurantiacus]|uniref:mannose-6-phosphate isomerase n=1 Tax=Litorihabitans aurantiacus TaxID=1930061 RepID=A0AA37UUM0_9MICO|nr:mannose-6-phosphate isomerase, class I [Litorihabitans aurantiacus]GMA30606.1 mannose-6-phosphate isomerase [Litorihabitans aurantiacus]